MVYQSQQILIPDNTAIVKGASSKRISIGNDAFSKVLGRNMRSGETLDTKDSHIKEEILKPLSSKRLNNRITSENQPLETPGGSANGDNIKIISQADENKPMKRADTSLVDVDVYDEPVDLVEEDAPSVEDMEQAEKLQTTMDEIIVILQRLFFSAETENTGKSSSAAETGTGHKQQVVLTDTVELRQALEPQIKELLETAQNLEGTKTSDIAIKFADGLQTLIDDGLAEMVEEMGGQVFILEPDKVKNLVGKMLNEAEKAKIGITTKALEEIVIPAMSFEAKQPISTGLKLEQSIKIPIEQQADTPVSNKQEKPVELKELKLENNFEEPLKEQTEVLTLKVDKEQKEPVLEIDKQTNLASFVDTIQTEVNIPEPVAALKPPVDVKTSVFQQAIEKAETFLSEDKTEMVIQLKPESLGKISLRVIHERGEIVARFMAESDQVKAILESNMQLLRDSLHKNGVSVQSLSVSVGQQNTDQDSGNDHSWQKDSMPGKRIAVQASGVDTSHQTYVYSGLAGRILSGGESKINLTA